MLQRVKGTRLIGPTGLLVALLAAGLVVRGQPPQKAPPQPENAELYELGKKLFDEYAPAEIKAEYEFPSAEQWNAFAGMLQTALQGDSLQDMAASEAEVRKTIANLEKSPEGQEYLDWLKERLDLIESARDALKPQPPSRPSTPPSSAGKVTAPATPTPPRAAVVAIPHYDLWLRRVQGRPVPAKAEAALPRLKTIFRESGLPAELAWLAEVESSFNASAKSPAGARGLYQLMPDTARSLGLSLFPFDERAQPEKNARAAAQLLRELHQRFRSWPLALAAYNAGPGRVGRALEKAPKGKFSDIAAALPAETRMYVPKVLATVAVREKTTPTELGLHE